MKETSTNKNQEEKLQETISYVARYSPYYRRLFQAEGIDPVSIRNLDDLSKLPFTTKDDIQKYNKDFYCVEPEKIIDYVTTSGTMGEPVTVILTDKDLDRLALNECESLRCTGGSPADIYQLMTTLDKRFMAGLAYFMGVRKLGAGVVRVGSGIPELQWDTIQRIRPSVLVTVPSFLIKMLEYAKIKGIDPALSSVRTAVCIGEPIRNPDFTLNTLGKLIQDNWDIQLYSTYASTEMATAFTECEAGQGGHQQMDLVLVEIIGTDNQAVKPGDTGELVITTLGLEGMPLVRFRTGDMCRAHTEPCSCGRSSMRLGPVMGRKQQMIKYKGTTLYPQALYDVLNGIKAVENYIIEISTNKIGTDEVVIRLGCASINPELEADIAGYLQGRLRVLPTLQFESPDNIRKEQNPPLARKPIVLVDIRQPPMRH
jgi:phenylacetate-CoA ligase